MLYKKFFILFFAIVLFLPSLSHSASEKENDLPSADFKDKEIEKNHRQGEVIIKYKKAVIREIQSIGEKKKTTEEKKELLEKKKEFLAESLKKNSRIDDLKIKEQLDDLGLSLVASETASTEEMLEKLKSDENVAYVEPNYLKTPTHTPNDALFSNQWGHYRSDDHDIDSTDAWDIENGGSGNFIVAVIDSGVDYSFSDLTGNMWDGSSGCLDELGANVSGGCPYHGWDYSADDNNPDDTPGSYQWHGTHVSSVFGATANNSTGISGISRYNHVKIMALRFGFDNFSEIKAISFAKNNGAKVINASYGGSYYSQMEKDAIDSFPGIFVAAAGNERENNDNAPFYPCSYSSTNLICVGASNASDQLASFSNYSENLVDIAAPGENIAGIQQDAYYYSSGTSLASPFVAGAIALAWTHNPSLSTASLREIILKSGDHPTELSGKIACSRRLNLRTAIQSAISETIPNENCASPIYRFWSDTKQGHFYTASEDEKNYVIANYPTNVWKYENVAFKGYLNQVSGTTPIYRFWSDTKQHHFYTASEDEKNYVIANYPTEVWKYENIAYYAYPSQVSETAPVYRFWSSTKQGHFYTISEDEKNYVIANYPTEVWKYEGIAYYTPN